MNKRLLISLIIFCISAKIVTSQPVKKYSVQEVKADLDYLRNTMEASHYNFYALTGKTKLDSLYTRIMNSVNDSLTALQVFRLFQPYLALANMSHCFMDYPWKEYYSEYIEQGGTVFPLSLYFTGNKVLVRANLSQNSSIEKNDELIAFDGNPINVILEKMYAYISGPANYFKNSQIEQKEFSRLYWFFFDKKDVFNLKLRKSDGQEKEITLQSIQGKEFEDKIRKQESLLQLKRKFHIINDVAYIQPGHFLNDIPFDPSNPALFDNTEFCHFMDSAFKFFEEKKANSLIINLRYNPGGDNSFSDYMISYFADKPFSHSSSFRIKTSEITKDRWRKVDAPEHQELREKILSYENGTYFEASLKKANPHPDSVRFKGKVYVIINRYSYSNSSSVAAIIQDYKFGKIVGEETAEIVSSYGAVHEFELPNTKWLVYYPKALGVRPNGDTSQRGVIPDYPISDNIFTDIDEVLEYTLNLIRKEN